MSSISTAQITTAQLYEQQREPLSLEVLTEGLESRVPITISDINRPGMALMGYPENFLFERIQILGRTEIAYLDTLSPKGRAEAMDRLFQFAMPGIIVTKGLQLPDGLLERANRHQVPILRTPQDTTPFIHQLTGYLDWVFAPSVTVHASLVDVYGVGLLFTGRSGIGKSETALDLVERGHRLVADDVVRITRRHGDILIGSCNEVLRHTMEIRGLGVIDVQAIFGIRAIRGQKRVEVEVHLTEWDSKVEYERLGLDDSHQRYLDSEIPLVTVPILPGKNITVIAEVIALNHLVKVYGYNPAKALNERLIETMRLKLLANPLVRDDTE
ncbi:MAG TPA: HPr(Ser) kinase/phosphatase [Candidatus Saccharimonadales bacterium]|nr:HPr(Ser) kinase/phosphatase [Candidatus Saccharimonadales bacterium]